MSALSQEQDRRIREIFTNENVDWAIINDLIPRDEQESIRQSALNDMRREGLPVDYPPGEAGLWGGRSAMEIKNRLVFAVNGILEKYREQIHQAICKDFAYCKRRREKQFETEGVLLCIGVADALLTAITSFPLPVTSVSVYLVKNKILDKWCGCDQKKHSRRRTSKKIV
jgi:hypothetical protein